MHNCILEEHPNPCLPLELWMQLPDAVHGHARCCRAGLDTQLGIDTLQMFFDGGRAGAQNIGNVAVDLALDDPIQYLSLGP